MLYTLMNKNTPTLQFEGDDDLYASNIIEVENKAFLPPALNTDDDVSFKSLNKWISNRCIPASRDNLINGLSILSNCTGEEISTKTLLKHSMALSLSDQYWIKPQNSSLSWDKINFFTNSFSEDIGEALFNGANIHSSNLNSPDNTSAGWLKKKWVIENGKRILIKASSSFQQEAFNECISALICKKLDIPHVHYSVFTDGHKSYCKCEDFITTDTELVSAAAIINRHKKNTNISKYEQFILTCEELEIPDISNSIDNLLVLDYIIGNQDRHLGNFGAVRDVNTARYLSFAPVFDSGTSLRYDTPTEFIDTSLDIESQPFESFHNIQIKLVKNADRFDLTKLTNISEEVVNLMNENNYYDSKRICVIADVINNRVQMLDKAFCRGYVNGIDELDLTQSSNLHR